MWTENKNVTISLSDRFICFILTVQRRWWPVFWGRQLKKGQLFPGKKCIRVTWLDDFLTLKWPGTFTALAPPLTACSMNLHEGQHEKDTWYKRSVWSCLYRQSAGMATVDPAVGCSCFSSEPFRQQSITASLASAKWWHRHTCEWTTCPKSLRDGRQSVGSWCREKWHHHATNMYAQATCSPTLWEFFCSSKSAPKDGS